MRDAASTIRGWLANPEWPMFGPGIGGGPANPGRMAARAAAAQCLDTVMEEMKDQRAKIEAVVEDHYPCIGSWIDDSTWIYCDCGWEADNPKAQGGWTDHVIAAIREAVR